MRAARLAEGSASATKRAAPGTGRGRKTDGVAQRGRDRGHKHGRGRDRGSFYIDAAVALIALFAVSLSCLALPELFIRKQEVDYVARAVARQIERTGMAGAPAHEFVRALALETGLDADVAWRGNFQGAQDKLQLRERFTVTVRYEVRVRIVDPAFLDTVYLSIPISKTVSGVSEVYWKDVR